MSSTVPRSVKCGAREINFFSLRYPYLKYNVAHRIFSFAAKAGHMVHSDLKISSLWKIAYNRSFFTLGAAVRSMTHFFFDATKEYF